MKCSEWEDLIYEYLDGELAQEMKVHMEEHCRSCAACNSRLQTIRQAMAAFRQEICSVEAGDGFTRKVMLEINKREMVSFWSYAVGGVLGSMALVLMLLTIALFPVLQIATRYAIQFISFWLELVAALPFNAVLALLFSAFLVFLAVAMRGVWHMEEGQV
ncbi:putative zinc-finger [Lucifera butyrica]|uniref:Anti-sigma-W factor RsiW n=1 Tax=Lucifera butyrica TaxID=1351585 RepID=A0A498RDR6_9FIRM|nr:zf-HC2 domain-containing protein [Lucifera butyrica]VBB09067.1 putative zinc-finger [Lucifera butyrica]